MLSTPFRERRVENCCRAICAENRALDEPGLC